MANTETPAYGFIVRAMEKSSPNVDIPCNTLEDAQSMARHCANKTEFFAVQILQRVQGSTFRVLQSLRGQGWN